MQIHTLHRHRYVAAVRSHPPNQAEGMQLCLAAGARARPSPSRTTRHSDRPPSSGEVKGRVEMEGEVPKLKGKSLREGEVDDSHPAGVGSGVVRQPTCVLYSAVSPHVDYYLDSEGERGRRWVSVCVRVCVRQERRPHRPQLPPMPYPTARSNQPAHPSELDSTTPMSRVVHSATHSPPAHANTNHPTHSHSLTLGPRGKVKHTQLYLHTLHLPDPYAWSDFAP